MVETAMSLRGVRSRLLAVWGLLIVLVATIVVVQRTGLDQVRKVSDDGHRHGPAGRPLLPVPIEQVGVIEIANAGVVHRFERDAAGAWFYHGVHSATQGAHQHKPDPEAAARIERAFAMFGRTRMERQFTLDFTAFGRSDAERVMGLDPNVRDYGVTAPSMLVLVYAPNNPEPLARYAVGDLAPDTVGRYVHVLGTSLVVTIANYQIDNLLQLVAEMSGQAPATRRASASQSAR
jgi:hypothetical protein